MTKPGTAIVKARAARKPKEKKPKVFCGALTRNEATKSPTCRQAAGWGTDHPGQGRCKLHGGASLITTGRYSNIDRPRVRDLVAKLEQDSDPLNSLPEIILVRAMMIDYIERYDIYTDALIAWHESYEATQVPLSEEHLIAFNAVVDEWEETLRSGRSEATERQLKDVARARRLLQVARGVDADDKPFEFRVTKPRQVLDVSDAYRMASEVSKMIERLEKIRAANAISRADLVRLMANLGNAVERHVRMAIPDDAQALVVLKAIRSDWLTLAAA